MFHCFIVEQGYTNKAGMHVKPNELNEFYAPFERHVINPYLPHQKSVTALVPICFDEVLSAVKRVC